MNGQRRMKGTVGAERTEIKRALNANIQPWPRAHRQAWCEAANPLLGGDASHPPQDALPDPADKELHQCPEEESSPPNRGFVQRCSEAKRPARCPD